MRPGQSGARAGPVILPAVPGRRQPRGPAATPCRRPWAAFRSCDAVRFPVP